MKFLKWLLVVVAVILAVLFVVGLFVPRNYSVERSKVVPGSPEKVFQFLQVIKNTEKFSPWQELDTNMVLTYSGPDRGAGAAYQWKSDVAGVGNGSWTIKSVVTNKQITADMVYDDNPATATYTLEPANNGTKVTWKLQGTLGWLPYSRLFGLFMDDLVGSDFEKGLNKLATVLPKEPEPPTVTIAPFPFKYALGIRGLVPTHAMGEWFARSYASIMRYVAQNKLEVERYPFAIYYNVEKDRSMVQACIAIKNPNPGNQEVLPVTIEAGNAATFDHFGAYETTSVSWELLRSQLAAKNLKAGQPLIEEYIGDPYTTPDKSKLQTRLYVRIN